MAPFVRREWGDKLTDLMWRVKQLLDPHGILAPNVLLSHDPQIHLKNLKTTPAIEDVHSASHCIECGFCEPVCPSRNVTVTPQTTHRSSSGDVTAARMVEAADPTAA